MFCLLRNYQTVSQRGCITLGTAARLPSSVWKFRSLHFLTNTGYHWSPLSAILAGVEWFSPASFWLLMIRSIFLGAYRSLVYILHRNIYLDSLPIFILFLLLLTCKHFFMYSGYSSGVRYMFCKNFNPFYACFFFTFLMSSFTQKVLVFMKYNLCIFLFCYLLCWCHILEVIT